MENPLLRPPVFYGALVVLWVIWLTGLLNLFHIAIGVYLCFVGLVLWSTVRHRGRGWVWGLLFGLLLLGLPVWVMAAAQCFIQWVQ